MRIEAEERARLAAQGGGVPGSPVMLPAEPGREHLTAAHAAALAQLQADAAARGN